MILDIEGASASWSDNKLHVAFDVVPEGRSHLDLKTGEVFQSSSFAALRKQEDKAISAKLFVTRREQSAVGAQLSSEMRYVPGRVEREPELWLIWRLADVDLAGFHALVLSGKTLRTAVIFLAHGELEYGWEPHGSGQKWDNEKNPSIPIENISFNIDLHSNADNAPLSIAVPDGSDRAFYADTARVNFALLGRLSSIEALLGRLSWTVGLIALITLALALPRFWH